MRQPLHFLWTPEARALRAVAALFALTVAYLAVGVHPFRAVQIWSFTIPFGLVLLLAPFLQRFGRTVVGVLALVGFVPVWMEAGLRSYLKYVHAADPKSEIVLEAIANTTPSESLEFLTHELGDVLLWTGATVAVILLGVWILLKLLRLRPIDNRPVRRLKTTRAVILLLVVVSAFGWIQRPWRGNLPPVYWSGLLDDVEELRTTWAEAAQTRPLQIDFARSMIMSVDDKPKTLVLVIGESTNRDRWSLYGYSRETTPLLKAIAQEPKNRLGVVRDAWSVDSSTVPAFRSMLTYPMPQAEKLPDGRLNAVAAFKAAGWRVTWISNQEDSAVRNSYAGYADHTEMLNRVSGRSSVSMDEKVLAPLSAALRENAPRHLIVVHLIGAHPHYRLRRPDAFERNWGHDAVAQRLDDLDRSIRVKEANDDYDEVMLYQDSIISRTWTMAHEKSADGTAVEWIYVSDHSQELGETANRTGHSATTAAGYRIPLLLWSSTQDRRNVDARPFRGDWFTPMLFAAAGIRLRGIRTTEDILAQDYAWVRPQLPFEDPDLDRVSTQ